MFRKIGRFLDKQTKERPFFSALLILIVVIVPGYARIETSVNKADSAIESAREAAENAASAAAQLAKIAKAEDARDDRIAFTNCQIRNTSSKLGRDRFNTLFTALEVIFTRAPGQTEEEKNRAREFVASLRTAVPLSPALEDVDCNDDGKLDDRDYAP